MLKGKLKFIKTCLNQSHNFKFSFRHKYLSEGTKRIDIDGLTSLKYDVIKIEKTLLYTKIYVNYNEKEILKQKYK